MKFLPIPWPLKKTVNQIQLKSVAPTPIPKNFLFDTSSFLYSYRKTSMHGNCKCDTCISDIMRKYTEQVLVQPTSTEQLKDRIAEVIKNTENAIHNQKDIVRILDWLLDELRKMS
jgi:hypothetical protein